MRPPQGSWTVPMHACMIVRDYRDGGAAAGGRERERVGERERAVEAVVNLIYVYRFRFVIANRKIVR